MVWRKFFFFFETSFICIDLIFSNQPKLIMDSGAHPALHSKCHHQIIYSKIKIKVEYPSPSTCKIWDFNSSETDLINRSVEFFDLLNLFSGKNVHEKIELFSKAWLNIFHNFIPNKIILCDNRDPPWMNENIKKKWLREKIGYFKVKEILLTLTLLF